MVLSDFGRDRLAYQGYDALFDPELRPRRLPLANRHILKMQAVYSCLDWLADQLSSGGNGHVWAEASAPASYETARRRQEQGSVLLQDVLSCGDSLFRLQEWIRRSLRLPATQEVDALLWGIPTRFDDRKSFRHYCDAGKLSGNQVLKKKLSITLFGTRCLNLFQQICLVI